MCPPHATSKYFVAISLIQTATNVLSAPAFSLSADTGFGNLVNTPNTTGDMTIAMEDQILSNTQNLAASFTGSGSINAGIGVAAFKAA